MSALLREASVRASSPRPTASAAQSRSSLGVQQRQQQQQRHSRASVHHTHTRTIAYARTHTRTIACAHTRTIALAPVFDRSGCGSAFVPPCSRCVPQEQVTVQPCGCLAGGASCTRANSPRPAPHSERERTDAGETEPAPRASRWRSAAVCAILTRVFVRVAGVWWAARGEFHASDGGSSGCLVSVELWVVSALGVECVTWRRALAGERALHGERRVASREW